MMTPRNRRTYAGMLAASTVAVAKQVPMRDALPAALPPRLRPSSLNDLEGLFDDVEVENYMESRAHRVARVSSAALLGSVDKKTPTQPAKLLRGDEKRVALDQGLQPQRDDAATDRSCPHCRLLFDSLYADPKWSKGRITFPPIAVVNHSARVNIEFDPETNVSKAQIGRFQVLVPEKVAKEMIRRAYPLDWSDFPESIFRRSDPVNDEGERTDRYRGDPARVRQNWQNDARGGAYVYEDVAWPVNEDISADSENVIKIFNFDHPNEWLLSYDYCLERCVRTNFGIAWEPSGLDIDGGTYQARATPFAAALEDKTWWQPPEAGKQGEGLADLKWRDVLEMRFALDRDPKWTEALAKGWSDPKDLATYRSDKDRIPMGDIAGAIKNLGAKLEAEWGARFFLVSITASKELHFTIPENNPIELWQSLTHTAPAFLFTFLNAAICHTPHVIIEDPEFFP